MGLKATASGLAVVSPYVQPSALLQTAALLPKTRAALGRVRRGSGNARILCIGDSTTNGYLSNGTTGDLKTYSWPGHLSAMLNASGVNAHFSSFLGSGNGQNATFDPRIGKGTGWLTGLSASMGGLFYYGNSSTSGSLSFTPSVNVDTFNFWYVTFSGYGTFSHDVDGGTATSINSAGATGAVLGGTRSTTLGAHTFNFKWVSGGNVVPIGVEAYDSTKSWVSVMNAGVHGYKSSDWSAQNPNYGYAAALTTMAPDLTIVGLGINDWQNGVSLSSFVANMQAIITNAKAVGDCALITPNPTNNVISEATQAGYVQALYSLAAANNVPIIDVFGRFSGFATANTTGLMGDTVHPNGIGYADIARAVMKVITI